MRDFKGVALIVFLGVFLLWGAVQTGPASATPAFDPAKIADMTGYDPGIVTFAPGDDTFKIGLMEAFSGPGAANGRYYWLTTSWCAYDYNKRGGIMVDGKKKMIEVIKGDTQSKPAVTKKTAERLCLERCGTYRMSWYVSIVGSGPFRSGGRNSGLRPGQIIRYVRL